MFVATQLIIQMCPSLLRWQLNLALQVSQGSASTCFRWGGHFRHSFVQCLFRDTPSNFYWNRFIFDRQGVKNKLATVFFRHGVVLYTGLMAAHGEHCLHGQVPMTMSTNT